MKIGELISQYCLEKGKKHNLLYFELTENNLTFQNKYLTLDMMMEYTNSLLDTISCVLKKHIKPAAHLS